MPEQGRESADHQDHRQDVKGQDEQGRGILHRIGLVRSAGQEAEHKARPGAGRLAQPVDRPSDTAQGRLGRGRAEQDQHQDDLDRHRAQGQAEGEAFPVLG